MVDLDRNYVMTAAPPSALTHGQRQKMISRLTNALSGDVQPAGVPQHLRGSYAGGKLIPAGQIIVIRGEVETIENPSWWNQDSVMGVVDNVCVKLVSQYLPVSNQQSLIEQGPQFRNEGYLWELCQETTHDQDIDASLE